MKNLFKALADFQQEVPVIHKGTEGYGYSYADLPAIFEVINPLLKKNGLGFTQLMEGKSIRTIVFHIESGETIESITEIPQGVSLAKMNEFQVLGSAITYLRRYSLSSALGLVTDKDTDAGGEQVKAPVKSATEVTEDTKKWINLFDKQGNQSLAFINLEKAIADGKNYTLKSIREKYKVSKQTEKELLEHFNIS
ncbi:MAG: ERF family protein [Lutibacter sp.]